MDKKRSNDNVANADDKEDRHHCGCNCDTFRLFIFFWLLQLNIHQNLHARTAVVVSPPRLANCFERSWLVIFQSLKFKHSDQDVKKYIVIIFQSTDLLTASLCSWVRPLRPLSSIVKLRSPKAPLAAAVPFHSCCQFIVNLRKSTLCDRQLPCCEKISPTAAPPRPRAVPKQPQRAPN